MKKLYLIPLFLISCAGLVNNPKDGEPTESTGETVLVVANSILAALGLANVPGSTIAGAGTTLALGVYAANRHNKSKKATNDKSLYKQALTRAVDVIENELRRELAAKNISEHDVSVIVQNMGDEIRFAKSLIAQAS